MTKPETASINGTIPVWTDGSQECYGYDSYADIIIHRFLNLVGNKLPKEINSAILLYNSVYDANEKKLLIKK
ncbi:hypothetical protein [Anaerocolumna jejuensis]|uniref:hypothetical protein n=1 Tax=Anaerocolumna jejuensis TaxID=259063 RepID=UPI003F7B5D9A